MKHYRIYSFADPRTREVRYVGATTQTPRFRLAQIRVGYYRGGYAHVGAWIAELDSAGLLPQMTILEDGTPDGIDGEKRWIAHYRALGAPLFNISDGGQGTNGVLKTEEWKRENGNRVRGRKLSDETKEKIGAGNRGKRRVDLSARNRANASLTPEQVVDIKNSIERPKVLAQKYAKSAALISMIRSGKRYACSPST